MPGLNDGTTFWDCKDCGDHVLWRYKNSDTIRSYGGNEQHHCLINEIPQIPEGDVLFRSDGTLLRVLGGPRFNRNGQYCYMGTGNCTGQAHWCVEVEIYKSGGWLGVFWQKRRVYPETILNAKQMEEAYVQEGRLRIDRAKAAVAHEIKQLTYRLDHHHEQLEKIKNEGFPENTR